VNAPRRDAFGKRIRVKKVFAAVVGVALLLLFLPVRWTGPLERVCQALFAPAGRYTILAARAVGGGDEAPGGSAGGLDDGQRERLLTVLNARLVQLEEENRRLLGLREIIDFDYGFVRAHVSQFDSLGLESIVIDRGSFSRIPDGAPVLFALAEQVPGFERVSPQVALATAALVGRIAYSPGPYTARVELLTSTDVYFLGRVVRPGRDNGPPVEITTVQVSWAGNDQLLAATMVPVTHRIEPGDLVLVAEPHHFKLPVALAVGTVEAVKPRIDSPLHADLSIRPYFQKAQLDTVYVLVVLPESGH